jgi:hypothetical protein
MTSSAHHDASKDLYALLREEQRESRFLGMRACLATLCHAASKCAPGDARDSGVHHAASLPDRRRGDGRASVGLDETGALLAVWAAAFAGKTSRG